MIEKPEGNTRLERGSVSQVDAVFGRIRFVRYGLSLQKLRILNKSLLEDFALRKPKIAVFGMNPHAGDGGVLGKEEDEIISFCKEYKKRFNIPFTCALRLDISPKVLNELKELNFKHGMAVDLEG